MSLITLEMSVLCFDSLLLVEYCILEGSADDWKKVGMSMSTARFEIGVRFPHSSTLFGQRTAGDDTVLANVDHDAAMYTRKLDHRAVRTMQVVTT